MRFQQNIAVKCSAETWYIVNFQNISAVLTIYHRTSIKIDIPLVFLSQLLSKKTIQLGSLHEAECLNSGLFLQLLAQWLAHNRDPTNASGMCEWMNYQEICTCLYARIDPAHVSRW